MSRNLMKPRLLVPLAVGVLFLSACGDDPSTSSSATDAIQVADLGTSSRLPHETLTDVVVYADAVAVVEITAEARVEHERAEELGLEGTAARVLTYEVSDVLWRNSSTTTSDVPKELKLSAGGFSTFEGVETVSKPAGAPLQQVGQTVLVALAEFPGEGWGLVSTNAVYLTDDQRTVHDEHQHFDDSHSHDGDHAHGDHSHDGEPPLMSRSFEEITEALAKTTIPVELAEFMRLDPDARLAAIVATQIDNEDDRDS